LAYSKLETFKLRVNITVTSYVKINTQQAHCLRLAEVNQLNFYSFYYIYL